MASQQKLLEQDHAASFWFLSLSVLFTKRCGCKRKIRCCYAGCECSTNIPQRQSTQPEVVAIFVIVTDIREMALEENYELSHEVDAIVGELDILELYYYYSIILLIRA